jgi:two-component system, chemotaxis family, chemotaxis protein CheY
VTDAIDADLRADLACSLTELQSELLTFERNQDTNFAPAIRESIQLLLRRAHSLKGVLRLAELPQSASLLHAVESLLVRHCQSERKVVKSSIDLVFDALDAVSAGLDMSREDSPRLLAVAAQVRTALAASLPAESDRRRFPFAPSGPEFEAIDAARVAAKRIYCVEKAIRTDISEGLYNHLPIREDLARTGTILACRPSFANIDRRRNEAIVTFIVSTTLSRNELEFIVFDDWAFCEWPTAPAPNQELVLAASPPPAVQNAESAVAAKRSKFLVVDDDRTCRFLLSELLARLGDCSTASNGRDALEIIGIALKASAHFDAVCLDIMMPQMDGHAVLKEIRRLEAAYGDSKCAPTKVIMTTALSGYEHFHRAFVEECDAYLVKPITKAILDRQLARLGIVPPGLGR